MFTPNSRTYSVVVTEIANLRTDITNVQTRMLQPALPSADLAALTLQLSELRSTLAEFEGLLIITPLP
jgi:hypothetical protein